VVVLTDGQSRNPDKTRAQAKRLKDMGVRIIAIGAGWDLRHGKQKLRQELLDIASSPEDMKMVDFANLENIVFEIVNKVCRIVTTTKPRKLY
jgi:putative N-acetylmannosamine-6-phosphate epimerase